MRLTYLGHASLALEIKGFNIIVDPFISGNELAEHINIDELKANYILITHGHGDHVADAERIAKNTGATIVSNFEIVNWFANKGIQGHPMNHGGKWKFEFGYVKYVNAIHSSSMPDGTYGGNPGGFVIWNDEICFYIAGDTALTEDMRSIPITCPKLDFSVLPVGDNFTMGYEDACLASDYLQCNKVIAYHFDTFGYIVVDKTKATEVFSVKNKELIFLQIGETMDLKK
jgi:L-ascorbate metabolism protein UlaG (beta-lactamase superfamily)